jgi:hypothetical protein
MLEVRGQLYSVEGSRGAKEAGANPPRMALSKPPELALNTLNTSDFTT